MSTKKKFHRYMLNLYSRQWRTLRADAKKRDVSVSFLIREIITNHYNKKAA
jgi:predicted DNA-binding ribbon-helix-helix protein